MEKSVFYFIRRLELYPLLLGLGASLLTSMLSYYIDNKFLLISIIATTGITAGFMAYKYIQQIMVTRDIPITVTIIAIIFGSGLNLIVQVAMPSFLPIELQPSIFQVILLASTLTIFLLFYKIQKELLL